MENGRRYADRRLWLVLLALLLTLAACSGGPAAASGKAVRIVPTATPKAFPNAAQLDAYIRQPNNTRALNGTVLVAHNGMVFSSGYGLADRKAHIANTPQTIFRIGSNSKQFTALAILLLQERGKLHVQDHLCLYISNCPQAWQPITLYQLLIHSSGIPNYTDFPDFVATWTQPVTPEQLIERFKDRPLDFPPGTKWSYSNSGYILLGYVIERVSGESYATFLRQNIFEPLRMDHSGYDNNDLHKAGHATGYYQDDTLPNLYDMSVVYAAGALYSTVEDLYVWDQALTAHRLLSPQSLDEMFTPHIACPSHGCALSSDQGYGYGWFIAQEPEGKLIYHLGRIDGYVTYNGFYPASNLYVIVLSNIEGTDVLKMGTTLAGMVAHEH